MPTQCGRCACTVSSQAHRWYGHSTLRPLRRQRFRRHINSFFEGYQAICLMLMVGLSEDGGMDRQLHQAVARPRQPSANAGCRAPAAGRRQLIRSASCVACSDGLFQCAVCGETVCELCSQAMPLHRATVATRQCKKCTPTDRTPAVPTALELVLSDYQERLKLDGKAFTMVSPLPPRERGQPSTWLAAAPPLPVSLHSQSRHQLDEDDF